MRREEYFDRIDRKLESDLASTAVKLLTIDDLSRFPLRGPIPVGDGATVELSGTNELLYLVNEGEPVTPSTFEVIPLGIRSQTVAGGTDDFRVGRQAVGSVTYSIVVHLKDIARLDSAVQRGIVNYIVEQSANKRDALALPRYAEPTQPLFPNHRDFWSYAKVTDRFLVPQLEKKTRRTPLGLARSTRIAAPEGQRPDTVDLATRAGDSVSTNVLLRWPAHDDAEYKVVVNSGPTVIFADSIPDSELRLRPLNNASAYTWRVDAKVLDSNGNDSTFAVVRNASFRTRAVSPASLANANGEAGRPGYTLDASFSRIALTHELLYSESALGIPRFGIEFGFDDPVLSLFPYQSPAFTWGGMVLINASSEREDILDRNFLQLKIMGRSRFNSRSFSENMGAFKYLFTPLVPSESPRLNIAVPGYGFEILASKWWGLPYLNFHYTSGSDEYVNPVFPLGPDGNRYAFWSTVQWRGSMAFYFNLDSEPEFYLADVSGKRLNVVRLDIGLGTYNVARVDYDSVGGVAGRTGVVKSSRIQPYCAVEYVHASRVKTAFGAKAAYFDNRLTLMAWISLFKLGDHELRMEGTDIVGPFGRSRFEWETAGSALLQFRYRLGF